MNKRIWIKAVGSLPPETINKLSDDLQRAHPQLAETYLAQVRRANGNLRPDSVRARRLVLEVLERENPPLLRELWDGHRANRPEPNRKSPTEQIKALTHALNPLGELTGGNYRASF